MRIAILGFGREGKSLKAFFRKQSRFRGAKVEILDKKFSKDYLRNIERFDVVFRSPGVPYNLPELAKARRAGVRFSSATNLFFEYSPTKNIIGVTGTKGKGTTCTLIYKIFKAAGFDAYLAGNIGKSALDLLPKLKKNSWVVLELSSFQLQDLAKSPSIAVILDIFPDHQDAHLNLKEYYEAKTNIARHQKKSDKIFFFSNNKLSRWAAGKGPAKNIAVSEEKFRLFAPYNLRIPGHHNFKNSVMAATVAKNLGANTEIIVKTIKNFRGNEHRLEFVRRIAVRSARGKNKHEIYFWNDSASTNPHTSAAAVKSFPNQTKILIAGGQDKGLDYEPLANALKNSQTKLIVLFGENRNKIAGALKKIKNREFKAAMAGNLRGAIDVAYRFAKRVSFDSRGLVILFSPGSASFDQFKNYADRGEKFKKLVKELK